MPKASGKVLGKTSASEASTATATSSCSRRPQSRIASAAAARELGVIAGRSSRGRRPASAAARPLRPPPRARARRSRAAGPRSPRAKPPTTACSASSAAPKPTTSRRASGWARWTSGQAASSRSTPLETISLPTKITRSAVAPRRTSRPPPRQRGGRDPRSSSPWSAGSGSVRRNRWASASSAVAALDGRGRREQRGVDARRAEPDLGVDLGLVDGAAQALGDVAGADQDPGGALGRLARVRAEALEVGEDRVREVGAVDLERVARARRARRITGAMTRWLASAASTPPELGDQVAHRGDVALEVARRARRR